MALTLKVRDVEDIGNGQYRCSFDVVDKQTGRIVQSEENYAVMAGARHGYGPRLFALIQARKFEGEIKPFVVPLAE